MLVRDRNLMLFFFSLKLKLWRLVMSSIFRYSISLTANKSEKMPNRLLKHNKTDSLIMTTDTSGAVRAPWLGNNIPVDNRLAETVTSFKSLLKSHFYRLDFIGSHPFQLIFFVSFYLFYSILNCFYVFIFNLFIVFILYTSLNLFPCS